MKTFYVFQFTMLFFICTASGKAVRVLGSVSNLSNVSIECSMIPNKLDAKPMGIVIPVNGGHFNHQFEVSEPTFLSFNDGTNYFGGLVEPGDSIFVQYDHSAFSSSIAFSGVGREKFEIAQAINQVKSLLKKHLAPAKKDKFPVDFMFSVIDSADLAIRKLIVSNKELMSLGSQTELLGYLSATALQTKLNSLVAIFGDSYGNILTMHRDKLSQNSIEQMQKLLQFNEAYYKSKFYVKAVESAASIYLEENVAPETRDFVSEKYQKLLEMLPEKLRSPVVFFALSSDISNNSGDTKDSVFLKGADLLIDKQLKQSILQMISKVRSLRVGEKAPEFSIKNLSGENVNLTTFQGKTVYIDFWFAACGPCHLLFKSIEPVKKEFENDDRVVFLTVSIDNESTWKKAISKYGLRGYHVFTDNKLREHPIVNAYNINAYPTTFIINPKGRFHSINPSNNPEILRKQIKESLDLSKQ
jgi:peroxiredoxin